MEGEVKKKLSGKRGTDVVGRESRESGEKRGEKVKRGAEDAAQPAQEVTRLFAVFSRGFVLREHRFSAEEPFDRTRPSVYARKQTTETLA